MRQYTREGKLWDQRHPAWPTKKDGSPYLRLPKAKTDEMKQDGTWPILFTSVTEYLKVLSSQHLVNWALGIGVDATLKTITGIEACGDNIEPGSLRGICYDAAVELRNSASDKGTAIHDALSKSLADPDFVPTDPVEAEAVKALGYWLWTKGLAPLVLDKQYQSENGFSFEDRSWRDGKILRYGGTRDLIVGDWLIDFKTTKVHRQPYESECAQLAAYNRDANKTTVCNLYFSSQTGKILGEKVWSKDELDTGWELFCACVNVIDLKEMLKVVSND